MRGSNHIITPKARMTTAVRAHAEDVRQKIEQVLTDTDRIVSSLESDEDQAAKQAS